MKDIYTLSLQDITPPNIAADDNISSLITAIDPQLQELSVKSLEPLILARIDELPENVLDLLAWQLHADFYDVAGNLQMKREAVKSSILWHMHKGTEWAIHEALRQIDISADFVPWWEDNSDPYTFKLKAIVTGDFYRTKGQDKLQASIRRAVYESKAARSHLADLTVDIHFEDALTTYAGVVPVLMGTRIIRSAIPDPEEETRIYVAPITIENRDISLGVDLDEMQELLQRFEARILSRIDQYEQNILTQFNTQQRELNLQLAEIKEMLRWKGDDEEA